VCAQKDTVTAAKLKAALGLAYLDMKKYKLAAKEFVEVGGSCCPAARWVGYGRN